MKKQIHIRASEATREKLEQLAERYGTITEAVAVAIDRLWQDEMKGENEMARTKQVNELREMAGYIIFHVDPGDSEYTAEQLVDYAIETWEDKPDWFEAHDRNLLIRFVEDSR